jgi:hypothetical protein
MAVPFPLPAYSLFIDAPYEGYGADHANGVAGVAAPGVTELRLGFRTGSPIFAQTTPAPRAKVRRHAYLEHAVLWDLVPRAQWRSASGLRGRSSVATSDLSSAREPAAAVGTHPPVIRDGRDHLCRQGSTQLAGEDERLPD